MANATLLNLLLWDRGRSLTKSEAAETGESLKTMRMRPHIDFYPYMARPKTPSPHTKSQPLKRPQESPRLASICIVEGAKWDNHEKPGYASKTWKSIQIQTSFEEAEDLQTLLVVFSSPPPFEFPCLVSRLRGIRLLAYASAQAKLVSCWAGARLNLFEPHRPIGLFSLQVSEDIAPPVHPPIATSQRDSTLTKVGFALKDFVWDCFNPKNKDCLKFKTKVEVKKANFYNMIQYIQNWLRPLQNQWG